MKFERLYDTDYAKLKSGDLLIVNTTTVDEDGNQQAIQYVTMVITSCGYESEETTKNAPDTNKAQIGFSPNVPNEAGVKAAESPKTKLPLFALVGVDNGLIFEIFNDGTSFMEYLQNYAEGFIPNERTKLAF